MATHLAHRLPWAALADVYEDAFNRTLKEGAEDKVRHFARCLVAALAEFKETDKRPLEDEEGHSVDASTWGIEAIGGLGYTGYYYSFLQGYVELNLLLVDGRKFRNILLRDGQEASRNVLLLCGYTDGGHPEWMAQRLKPILTQEDAFRMEPLTADVLQRIRDHCALLFRCLYSIGGENTALDAEFVARCIGPMSL